MNKKLLITVFAFVSFNSYNFTCDVCNDTYANSTHSSLTGPVGFLSHVFNISQRYSHPQHKKTSKYFSCVNLMKYLRCQNQGKYLCQTQTAAKNLLCRKAPTESRDASFVRVEEESQCTQQQKSQNLIFSKQTSFFSHQSLVLTFACFHCTINEKNNFNCIIIVYMQHQGHSVLSLEYTVNRLPIQ